MSKKNHNSIEEDLADYVNGIFKKSTDKVAYFLDGSDSNPSDISDWVSSGNDMLDIAISNRKNGGFPVGRITEISGMEASGKSLLACHAMKSTQEKGGIAVYIDTENAASEEFMKAIGVNVSKMLYLSMYTVEDIFDTIEQMIIEIRKKNPDILLTIVIDSIMGATTKAEKAIGFDKQGWNTSKSIIISQAMRKITNYIGRHKVCLIITNQLRVRLGALGGDIYTTSGGKGIPFHSSVRLRLEAGKKVSVEKNGKKHHIGVESVAHVKKNRLGPANRSISYKIYYNSGMDNYGSWLDEMSNRKIVDLNGAWYTYRVVDKETGEVLEEIKFQSKQFYDKIISNPKYKEIVYNHLCDELIFKYNINEAFDTDTIIIEEDNEDDY
jgi:recombination protein RecA